MTPGPATPLLERRREQMFPVLRPDVMPWKNSLPAYAFMARCDPRGRGLLRTPARRMLTGFVRSYAQKTQAEQDAKRVAGVVGIANDIEVRLPAIDERPDPDIVRDAVNALKSELPYSADSIQVVAKNGWLTLEGSVEWNYIRKRAVSAVRHVRGVKGVTNSILVKPKVAPYEVRRKIEDALRRSAELDASRITVEASGSEVILRGTVRSWAEREEAERAAWAAPGVSNVDNRVSVSG